MGTASGFSVSKRFLQFKTANFSIDAFIPNLLGDSRLTTESAVLQFSFFWGSDPTRNAAKGVNTSRRFVESLRMTDS